jgi:hypothetical protein
MERSPLPPCQPTMTSRLSNWTPLKRGKTGLSCQSLPPLKVTSGCGRSLCTHPHQLPDARGAKAEQPGGGAIARATGSRHTRPPSSVDQSSTGSVPLPLERLSPSDAEAIHQPETVSKSGVDSPSVSGRGRLPRRDQLRPPSLLAMSCHVYRRGSSTTAKASTRVGDAI